MDNPDALFERHADAIRRLPDGPLPPALLKSDTFLLARRGSVEIFYAPFDYVNPEAKVAIVGITPGWKQMEIAFRSARSLIREGLGRADVCRIVKEHASFAGPMRTNLLNMLDRLGLPQALGISTSADLFGSRRNLLQTTSVVRYPVFVKGRNYTGKSPLITRDPLLREFIASLAEQLSQIPNALVVPLGKQVSDVISLLADRGEIARDRVLFGFPHPSGANGHRHAHFEAEAAQMRLKIREWLARA